MGVDETQWFGRGALLPTGWTITASSGIVDCTGSRFHWSSVSNALSWWDSFVTSLNAGPTSPNIVRFSNDLGWDITPSPSALSSDSRWDITSSFYARHYLCDNQIRRNHSFHTRSAYDFLNLWGVTTASVAYRSIGHRMNNLWFILIVEVY
jgi:hypothetical protein